MNGIHRAAELGSEPAQLCRRAPRNDEGIGFAEFCLKGRAGYTVAIHIKQRLDCLPYLGPPRPMHFAYTGQGVGIVWQSAVLGSPHCTK